MDVHDRIAREFEAGFVQDGFGRVEDRSGILKAFLQHEDHVSADRLAKEFADRGTPIDPAFVERVLEQFVRYGLAIPIMGEDGRTRFEHLHIGRHHHHVICVDCGRIAEVQPSLQRLVDDIGVQTGYQALHAHLQVHGLCPTCAATRTARFPLTRVTAGEKARVVEILGGQAMYHRLLGMGLRVGTVVRRQNTDASGPVILSIGSTRLALGHGMAEKVIVEQVKIPQSGET